MSSSRFATVEPADPRENFVTSSAWCRETHQTDALERVQGRAEEQGHLVPVGHVVPRGDARQVLRRVVHGYDDARYHEDVRDGRQRRQELQVPDETAQQDGKEEDQHRDVHVELVTEVVEYLKRDD